MIIIGITGTLGAGKGTIVQYLKEKYGYIHFSARDFIVEEIEKRGLPINRDSMIDTANDLRKKFGPSYITEQLHERAIAYGNNAVIESLRAPGEIEALRKKDTPFYLFAVDADPKIRYERIVKRKSSTDHITFEKFLIDEAREMTAVEPHMINLSACIKLADYTFTNNSDIHNLQQKIDAVMTEIQQQSY